MRYYKSFREGRIGPYSKQKWPKRIGAWVKVEGPLEVCKNGIHVARGEKELLVHWLSGPEVYEVEVRGDRIDAEDKACVRECRLVRRVLDERSLRLFAADCAESALSVANVTDERSWDAVRVARLFAVGAASNADLAAAWAAWAAGAAGAAAWAAAWDAARAAGAAVWDRQAALMRWYIDGEQGPKPKLLEEA